MKGMGDPQLRGQACGLTGDKCLFPRYYVEKLLILLVGAGRFERPTPCAQGGFRPSAEIPCFQVLTFQ